MKQTTLAEDGFEKYSKTTRRAAFLTEMDRVVLWQQLCELIEPHYPNAGNGRPPIRLERMLRLHSLQHAFVEERRRAADPEMGTTKKGSNWLFGMKAHVGVDRHNKLIHHVVGTPGNVADGKVIDLLLHRRESGVWATKPMRNWAGPSAAVP